ncbi:MAG: class I SAM-dependent methyltransferase [Candidatus Omnitrophica bacterium]|nr:class I SAM-dependent methyltransferase [Candidatus Omnitrophota bacterium]
MREKQIYNNLHKIWDSAHFGGSPTYMIRKILLKKTIEEVISDFKFKKQKESISVLDIGCGTGDYINIFTKYRIAYTGLDLSNYAINELRKKYPKEKYPELNFICEDIFKYQSKDKYDIAFLSEVLEHINDEIEFLKIINNFLVKDGILILSVPYDQSLWSYADEQAQHKRRYSKDYLRSMLERSGFNCNKLICYGFPLLRIYWSLTKRFRKKIQNEIKPPAKRLFLIINKIFLLDLLFLRTNRGVGLIAVAQKG